MLIDGIMLSIEVTYKAAEDAAAALVATVQ